MNDNQEIIDALNSLITVNEVTFARLMEGLSRGELDRYLETVESNSKWANLIEVVQDEINKRK
jgi:hypothetical protein